MEHIFDDSALSARALGVLLWCQNRERFTAKEIQLRFPEFEEDHDGLLDLLTFFVAVKGYFQLMGDYEYAFIGGKKKERVLTVVEAKFEEFRLQYKKITGCAVPGLETALKLLKKHKDWREVVQSLLSALEREAAFKAHLKRTNQFCPPWPNFSTWMNQRRWENEFDIPAPKDDDWGSESSREYVNELYPYPMPTARPLLTKYQFDMWIGKIGPFLDIDKRMSPAQRRQKFLSAHVALQSTPQIVEKAGGLFPYLVSLCKQ